MDANLTEARSLIERFLGHERARPRHQTRDMAVIKTDEGDQLSVWRRRLTQWSK